MSSYEKRRDEMLKKYGAVNKEEKTSENTKSTTSAKSSYETRRDEMLAKYSPTVTIDSDYINSFVRDVGKYMNSIETDYKGMGSSNSRSLYDQRKTSTYDLRARGSAISKYLDSNKDNMDADTYNSLKSYINSFDSASGNALYNFYKANEYYSQWESDEHYFRNSQDTRTERLKWYDEQTAKVSALEKEYQTANSKRRKEITAEMDSINTELRLYERGENGWTRKKVDDYYGILESEDFASGSSNRTFAKPTQENLGYYDAMMDTSQWYWDADGNRYDAFGNKIYEQGKAVTDEHGTVIHPLANDERFHIQDRYGMWKNATEDDRRIASATREQEGGYNSWANAVLAGDEYFWNQLTDKEVGIYYYLLNTQGSDAASKFLDDMEVELAQRETSANTQQWSKDYDEASFLGKVFMNAATVPANVFGGTLAFLDDSARQLRGEETNPYNGSHSLMHYSNTVRRETAEDLDKTGFEIPVIDFSLGDIYQTAMSRLDSVLATSIGGGAGTILLGMGAASNEAYRLYQQGASEEQVLLGAWSAGAAEAVFEYLSFDKLVKMKDSKTLGQWVKNALIQGGIEASEEGFTEVSNIITNAIIMRGESDWVELIENNGGSTKGALGDAIKQTAQAMFGGFLGGFGAGGVQGGKSYVNTQKQYTEDGKAIMNADGGVEALQKLANDVAGVSDAKVQKALTKKAGNVSTETATGNGFVSNKIADAKNAINANKVGRLYNAVQGANNLNNASANKADIVKSLERNDISSDTANDIAEALVASYNGQDLTRAQEKLLKAVENDKDVQDAIRGIVNNDMSTMGQRNQNIKSFAGNVQAGLFMKELQSVIQKKTVEKEFTPTGEYEVSENGKAFVKSDPSKSIDIKGVASVRNGNMDLELADGTTINANDVSFASDGEALVYEAIANLGDNIDAETANKLISKYDGKNAEVFARGIAQAYSHGFYGIDRTEMAGEKTLSSKLTKEQRNYAYGLGEKYRSVKDQADVAKNRLKKAPGEKGVYYRGNDGTATDIRSYLKKDGRHLNDMQTTAIEFMEKMSKTMGVRFNVFESWVEGGTRYYINEDGVKQEGSPNGFYDPRTGEIYIDLFAGNDFQGTMLFTIAHEMTHFMKQWSPAHFTKISKIVFQHAGFKGSVEQMVADKMAMRKAKGKPISYDTAVEEVVADGMETILKDGNVVEFMADVKKTDHKAWAKLKEFFKNLADFLKQMADAYSGRTAQTVEGKKVAEFSKKLINQIEQIWAEGAAVAGENYQSALENVVEENAEAVSSDEIITDGAVVTDGEGTKFSIKSMKHDIAEGQMFEDLKTYCDWTQEQVDSLRNSLNDLVEYMTPHRNILDMNESYGREGRRFSPYKPNSDPLYKISMDFSTLCSKRLLTQYVIENLQLRENRPMSAEEQMAIRDMLNEYRKVEKGLQVACAMCYVEAARLKSPKQIQRWLNDPAPLLRDHFAKKNKEFNDSVKEAQADFKESRGYARNTPKKDMKPADVKELNKIGPKLRTKYQLSAEEQAIVEKAKTLPNSTYLTAGNLSDLSETDPVIYDAYTAFVRTATRSKSLETDEPYYYGDSRRDNGNGIIVSDSFIEAVNRENGMRFSSWSDWRIQHLLDYITAVIDNSVRGAAMHGYTKFGEEVRVLGKTGMMFNMSGVAGTQNGLNEDGSLNFSPTESIDVDEAIQLREEFPETAGLQCIGVSDAHIIALLRSDIIDYVIPYHVSGLNAALRRMADIYGWDDYTGTQNASIDKSIKKENAVDPEHWHEEPAFSEFFVGYDTGMSGIEAMRASAERYKKMCKDRGLTPKFNQFANEDNYWKLLIDRKMINQQTGELIRQKAVTPTFEFNTIKEVVDRYVDNYDSGLEARALNHIVENWDSIPKRIRDLKKQGGTKAKKTKKAVGTLANQTLAAQPVDKSKLSMRESVEETKDLLAYHNITPQLLLDVLKRNSLLMPSLAITNKGMTDFGEISLLFYKSTIDPNVNAQNKLYGADAWTPTQTELKKNAKFDTDKTVRTVNTVKNRIGSKFASELFDVSPKQFKNAILKADGSIYNAYAHNIGMQTAYAMEKGIISKIPTNKDGTLNKTALQEQVSTELDTDNGWRQYKKWLRGISDDIITSYDRATNQEILNDMKAQPATAKTFKLSETGELVVPAAEYADIDTLRKNKNRLSENAEEATKAVADKFLALAKKIDGNTKSVVNAINASFANRYSVSDIVKSFNSNGIKISTETASELQSLYKQAVELPTQYFEAKPGREVSLEEIKAVVMPAGESYAELKGKLEELGITVVEYDGSKESRVEALNSMDNLKFSDRDTAPTFYSHMAKVVDAVKQEKLGASSVVNMLRGKGVKAEEIKWSGIEEWLAGKKSVTKAELQEFIAGSMLQIEEQTTSEVVKYTEEQKLQLDDLAYDRDKLMDSLDQYWFGLFGDWMSIDVFASDAVTRTVRAKVRQSGESESDSGKQLLQLADDIDEIDRKVDAIASEAKRGSILNRWSEYALDGGENYREIIFKIPGANYTNRAMKAHWGSGAMGVLAHARVQDFDVNGKKMLFIEEIQSDWHNEGHSKGYESAEYKEAERVSDEMFDKWQKIRQAMNKYARSSEFNTDPEDVRKKKWDWFRMREEEAYKKRQEADAKLEALMKEGNGTVPDAPFRNNYHEFVLKRLLRMAAEDGYDSIGWTTADIQSERWSEDYAEGYRIEYDQDIPKFLNKYGKKWEAKVGKTILENSLGNEDYTDTDGNAYDSIREWYDSVMDSYATKDQDVWNQYIAGQTKVIQVGNTMHIQMTQTGEILEEALHITQDPVQVWSMAITDSMKESVMTEGQPLYSERVLMGSLFSGGGTLEAGLVYQMLDKEFAVEYNEKIAATYTDNHGKEHMFVGDVQDFDSKGKKNVFYLHASPVCKNFSPASHGGGEKTLDIVTAQATARVLEEQMPQVFTVENVKRYIGSEAYKIITDKLTELGYKWDVDVYKASDYGNATKRERMIIRAVKDGDLPAKPAKVSGITSWGEATRDLWDTDLIPSTLVKSKIEAIRNTPELKNLRLTKLDKPLMIYDTTKSKKITYAWADELAPTLTTKCGDARIIMPDGRVYEPTPKFMGRIQGLPDDYKYPKAKTRAFTIIGNGIPTQLTKAVMGGVLDSAYEQTHDGQVLYQDRTEDSVSNRSLLANAFEGIAKPQELPKIQEYKEQVALINAEEKKLRDLNEQIKELSFAKGPRDTKKIKSLQFEANQTANRINTYDKILLRMEASKPLQDVLAREKKRAYQRAEKRGKEALDAYREKAAKTQRELLERWQDSRKKGIDSRNRTAMRHKIKDVVNELNQYLLRGTKERHVPIELQKAVAEALDAVNMDTVGAEERIAKLEQELMKAKTPEQIQEISRKIDHIREMGDKMNGRLQKLKDAYDQIVNSDDPLIANSHDEVISNKLESVIKEIGDTPLRDMTLTQLEDVYDMYRMVLTTIRNANKAFKAKKSESISVLGNQVMMEVEKVGGKNKYHLKGLDGIKSFGWNNLKPVYAFERIGSGTLTDIFNNVRAGEDVWAMDTSEAKVFRLGQEKKHNFNSWDFNKRFKFESTSGMEFELSLQQIMSLYAFSKREQAAEHLRKGGIVFDETTEVTMKSKLGIPLKFNPTEATAYNLSDETLADIVSKLSNEQKSFVDEMQDYLSTTMGAKGNEVSLELYGIKLFKEKFYFPLKSATQFMAKAKEQQQGEVKVKNKGFSKETVQKASNPIVLTPFMDVWADHVNEMSMYHAFVLPMEDFYRVYNYKTPVSDTMATESVEMFIQNAYGKAATKYIDQLLKDLNGGAISDPRESFAKAMTAKFKKAKVFSSLSVVIQQPSAIGRAFAVISPKYFRPTRDGMNHKELWAELKQYAPVAVIKEMGYFDTNMGRSAKEFILSNEYEGIKEKAKALVTDSGYRDEALSKLPALADEVTWCAIWNAVKRETVATHKNLRPGSDEFLKAAGERFTEVVTKTQVYDSVLSRSANMRSKSGLMGMITSFMAEPTTTINMLEDAVLKAKRGDKGYARKAFASVMVSIVLNNALVALVYGMRDDDEDETYLEKYTDAFVSNMLDDINPLTYYPYIKDLWSLFQGYDVERADVSLFSDFADSAKALIKAYSSEDGDVGGAWWDLTGTVANLFGIPMENIRRDVNGAINLVKTLSKDINGRATTWGSMGDTLQETVRSSLPVIGWLKGESKSDKLYDAISNGDKVYAERLKSSYKDENAYSSAVSKALRDNDPRIKEAAQAQINGNPSERVRIAKLIIADGFAQDDVVRAINAEINAMAADDSSSSTKKAKGFYTAEDFATEIANGDQASAYAVKADIIATAEKNGKTAEDAVESFNSSAMSQMKKLYLDGDITETKAINALVTYCDKTEEDAQETVSKWEFEAEYGFSYSNKAETYKKGDISAYELKSILMDEGGMTSEEADSQIEAYDWEAQGYDGATAAAVREYNKNCAVYSVPKDVYLHIRSFSNNTKNDTDANGKTIYYSAMKKVMAEIHAQYGLSSAQKTAIARSLGWSEKNIQKYKLW